MELSDVFFEHITFNITIIQYNQHLPTFVSQMVTLNQLFTVLWHMIEAVWTG